MNEKLASLKKFVSDNKVAIITTTIAVASSIAMGAMVVRNQAAVNEFLEEHNLTDEFYAQD